MNQQSIYATIKNNTDIGNSEANTLARVIWSDVVKYGKFWEKEGISAERKKWEKKNLVESRGRLLTNEERVSIAFRLCVRFGQPDCIYLERKELRDNFGGSPFSGYPRRRKIGGSGGI